MASVLGTKCDVPKPDERLEVSVTFDERRGYVASAPELRQPIVALSLGGLRRRIEIALLPDDVRVVLQLDGLAERERNRRRAQAQLSKVQSVDQRMQCGVRFRQLRTCRHTRRGQVSRATLSPLNSMMLTV
jgi:hypothetical protein